MSNGNLQQLGQLLRERRTETKLTVRQLAEKTGLVGSTISRYETGQIDSPRPEHLQQLSRALDLDIEDLYALAGYLMPEGLPELRPYLRAKYNLGDAAAQRIEGYFHAMHDLLEEGIQAYERPDERKRP